MSGTRIIEPIHAFRVTLRLPGSKSLTNRALLLAALAQGDSTLRHPLWADDTRLMFDALRALGVDCERDETQGTMTVRGCGGEFPAPRASLNLGLAGTTYRFLAAACCLGKGEFKLDGNERMRQRPIAQLVEPLRRIGGEVEYLGTEGFPPIWVRARGLSGGELDMEPTLSSQYISALLHVAARCDRGLTLNFRGPITSRPYVEMTLSLLRRFGVEAAVDERLTRVSIAPRPIVAADYEVEPDASNASYFLAAAAAVPGSRCTVHGLGFRSLQGDVWFGEVLQRMGASVVYEPDSITVASPPRGERLRGVDVDLSAMPDTAQTLAAIAPLCLGPTTIRNVGNLRVKETDRLAALRTELTRLGVDASVEGDDLCIEPNSDGSIRPATVATYDDHRMAMSFAVLGLARAGVTLADPRCVAKSFPDFFETLELLRSSRAGSA